MHSKFSTVIVSTLAISACVTPTQHVNQAADNFTDAVNNSLPDITSPDMSPVGTEDLALSPTSNKVVLLIHGIDFSAADYNQPIRIIAEYSPQIFLLKWSKMHTFSYNVNLARQAIIYLSKLYPSQQVLVFAHSAGGVIALAAFEELMAAEGLPPNVYLHTMAAPVNGYGAPNLWITYLGAPIFGATTMAIGIGMTKSKVLTQQCEQWITIDCHKDRHACPRNGALPEQMSVPPCGSRNVHLVNNATHSSIISYTIDTVLHQD